MIKSLIEKPPAGLSVARQLGDRGKIVVFLIKNKYKNKS
jgi:hypothetical protein